MIVLAILLVISVRTINCYLNRPLRGDSHAYRGINPFTKTFGLFSSNADILDPNLGAASESGIAIKVDTESELSNVKAVRYFINLTNGIEAVAPLLKQGVPMEHINVR